MTVALSKEAHCQRRKAAFNFKTYKLFRQGIFVLMSPRLYLWAACLESSGGLKLYAAFDIECVNTHASA